MWVWACFLLAFTCPPEEASAVFLLLLGSSGSAPSHSCDYFLSLLSSEVQANLSAAHTLLSPSFSCTLHTSSYQLEDQLLRKNHHQGELPGKNFPPAFPPTTYLHLEILTTLPPRAILLPSQTKYRWPAYLGMQINLDSSSLVDCRRRKGTWWIIYRHGKTRKKSTEQLYSS